MTAVPRLILIEGMIGSGKTTTAGHLADWLARRGEHVRAFGEGAADHPIRTRRVDELLAAPAPGDPGAYSAGQWRRLAERCLRDEQTIICESVFLQNSVMPAFIDGAPVGTVAEICTEIQRQAAPAEPFLVYLRPADIAAAIARVHQARGEPWSSRNLAFVQDSPWARRRGLRGRDAVVGLYQAWEPVAVELFDRYPFGKVMVPDPQHDWPSALRAIRAAVRPLDLVRTRWLRQYGSRGGRRRSVIAAVAVAVTASTDQGGSPMSYAIIHQATLPAAVTDS